MFASGSISFLPKEFPEYVECRCMLERVRHDITKNSNLSRKIKQAALSQPAMHRKEGRRGRLGCMQEHAQANLKKMSKIN